MNAWTRVDVAPVRPCAPGSVTVTGTIPSELIRKPGTNTVMLSALAIRSSRTVPKFIQAPESKDAGSGTP